MELFLYFVSLARLVYFPVWARCAALSNCCYGDLCCVF